MTNGSSGMLRRVALVRTDVSEELSASVISVTRIGELGTTLAVTSTRRTVPSSPILVTLMEVLPSFETSDLTRATRRNIPEDVILHVSINLASIEHKLKPHQTNHAYSQAQKRESTNILMGAPQDCAH
jgi:hypothetical protein